VGSTAGRRVSEEKNICPYRKSIRAHSHHFADDVIPAHSVKLKRYKSVSTLQQVTGNLVKIKPIFPLYTAQI
jgi:hypothetical protein